MGDGFYDAEIIRDVAFGIAQRMQEKRQKNMLTSLQKISDQRERFWMHA